MKEQYLPSLLIKRETLCQYPDSSRLQHYTPGLITVNSWCRTSLDYKNTATLYSAQDRSYWN